MGGVYYENLGYVYAWMPRVRATWRGDIFPEFSSTFRQHRAPRRSLPVARKRGMSTISAAAGAGAPGAWRRRPPWDGSGGSSGRGITHCVSKPSRGAKAAPSSAGAAAAASAPPTTHIPVVDLALSDDECVAVIRAACDDVGFFHVVNHGVEASLTREVMLEGAGFFDLPLATKTSLVRGEMRISRGYEISPEHQAVMLEAGSGRYCSPRHLSYSAGCRLLIYLRVARVRNACG